MNLFFRIVENATKLMDKFSDYDSYLYEMHHSKKKDSPSGTAVTLGQIMIDNSSKTKVVHGKLDREKENHELHIASIRAGNIPGVHTVGFDSEADTIELTHNARSRRGFAAGSVMAAEFIVGKKGFFEFKDIIDEIIGDKNV